MEAPNDVMFIVPSFSLPSPQSGELSNLPTEIPAPVRGIQKALERSTETPDNWEELLKFFFPNAFTSAFAPHHADFWEWVWSVEKDVAPDPYINIWARGGGKTISNECAVVTVGHKRARRNVLIVSETQEQADSIVGNIATRLESLVIATADPDLAARRLNKYGSSKGWRRNRLTTASGLTVQGIGILGAVRGLREEDARPDFIIFDDVDNKLDSLETTERKIKALTTSILPAGSTDVAILGVQNLIIQHGIFSRLAGVADEQADFLVRRRVSGPVPAIRGLETDERFDPQLGRKRWVITGGTATWEGQNLAVCQRQMDADGFTSFLQERQHEVADQSGGMYAAITFRHCDPKEVPDLLRTVLWVDPAVTNTDKSDAMGIMADGLGADDNIYRLYFDEERSSPEQALRKAILKGIELKVEHVGIETDQGGDTWKSVYDAAARELIDEGIITKVQVPPFKSEKAGAGHGPKLHRQQQTVVTEYERGKIVHVRGKHVEALERALKRFGLKKPFDGADAGYYTVWDLRKPKKRISWGR